MDKHSNLDKGWVKNDTGLTRFGMKTPVIPGLLLVKQGRIAFPNWDENTILCLRGGVRHGT
jgi:hypothetical protein